MASAGDRVLCVGVGSPQGNDRAGWLVIDALAANCPGGLRLLKAGQPVDLLDWIEGVSRLWLVDACQGWGKPGDWSCWRWPAEELPAELSGGTHDLGVSAVLEWARALGRLPGEVRLWGIWIDRAGVGEEPTELTQRTAVTVAEEIRRECVRLSD